MEQLDLMRKSDEAEENRNVILERVVTSFELLQQDIYKLLK